MPRRAKTTFSPMHLVGILAAVIAVAGGAYFLFKQSTGNSGGNYAGVTTLSLTEYLEKFQCVEQQHLQGGGHH